MIGMMKIILDGMLISTTRYGLVGAPDEDEDANGNNQELGAGSAYLIKKKFR